MMWTRIDFSFLFIGGVTIWPGSQKDSLPSKGTNFLGHVLVFLSLYHFFLRYRPLSSSSKSLFHLISLSSGWSGFVASDVSLRVFNCLIFFLLSFLSLSLCICAFNSSLTQFFFIRVLDYLEKSLVIIFICSAANIFLLWILHLEFCLFLSSGVLAAIFSRSQSDLFFLIFQ